MNTSGHLNNATAVEMTFPFCGSDSPAASSSASPASPKDPIVYRERTQDEQTAIDSMRCVVYPPASWHKRFMFAVSRKTTIITDGQAAQVWRLFYRYRRQIDHPDMERLLEIAQALAAPDFRKAQAARDLKSKFDEMRKAL